MVISCSNGCEIYKFTLMSILTVSSYLGFKIPVFKTFFNCSFTRKYCLFVLIENSFFSHTVHPDRNFSPPTPPTISPTIPLPQVSFLPLLSPLRKEWFSKRKQPNITKRNKTRQNHSFLGWTWLPNKRKRVPRAQKRVRDTPVPQCIIVFRCAVEFLVWKLSNFSGIN